MYLKPQPWGLYGVRVRQCCDAALFPNYFGQTCYYITDKANTILCNLLVLEAMSATGMCSIHIPHWITINHALAAPSTLALKRLPCVMHWPLLKRQKQLELALSMIYDDTSNHYWCQSPCKYDYRSMYICLTINQATDVNLDNCYIICVVYDLWSCVICKLCCALLKLHMCNLQILDLNLTQS